MKIKHTQPGFVAIVSVFILFSLLLVSLSVLKVSSNIYSATNNSNLASHAQMASDAGVELAMHNLKQDPNWSSPTGEVELMNINDIKTTYALSLDPASQPDEKILRSTGRVYRPANSTAPTETRAYEMIISAGGATAAGSDGEYSLIAGPGGLRMIGGAKINGSVYIGGTLTISNGSGITTGPGKILQVADNRCPIGGGNAFPRVCNPAEASQPITSSSGATITGTVMANNQTDGTKMSDPGLVPGAVDVHTVPPPPDRAPLKAAATGPGSTAMSGSSAGCSTGKKSWPANTKITGNVSIYASCEVTITGTVWITGTLTIFGSAKLIVSESLTEKPIIMIDGASGATFRGSANIQANSSGVGVRMVTYYSTASCSPECTDVTGTNLYNSQTKSTFVLQNNTTITNGNEFIAAWTTLDMQNGSEVKGAISAQRINLSGGADIGSPSKLTNTGTLVGAQSDVSIRAYRRVY